MSRESIRLRAADLFDVPPDTRGGLLHIEMTGDREIFIENHKGILEFGDTEVSVNAGKKSVRVVGQRLCVLAMNAEEVRISGVIESVSFV